MLRVSKVIETITEEMSTSNVKGLDRDVADRMNIDELSRELCETLVMLTEKEAKMMIRGVTTQDGMLAWHRSYRHYDRRTLA